MRKALIIVLAFVALGLAGFAVGKFQSSSRQSVLGSLICRFKEGANYKQYQGKDEMWGPNNKFGLYVYAENADYFEIAQNLVNSNGGEWGYVLVPYNMGDNDVEKWGRVFDQLNSKKLIPIVQLWSLDMDEFESDTKRAAEFFDQFIWPIKDRYVSVYNEPNSADFWFGYVSPAEYARVLDDTIDTFKRVNGNYFMLNAGFNTSAPNDDKHMDAFDFMKAMNVYKPGIFEKLDGWASHSYPQPNFSGNPHAVGRWSIRAYDTELDFLKDVLFVDKDLPVFITETGWAHAEGENHDPSFNSVELIGDLFKQAYEDIWLKDDKVRAVTPFTIRYDPPFDHFSWVNKDNVPYKHYKVVRAMKKVKGRPPSLVSSSLMINVCDVIE